MKIIDSFMFFDENMLLDLRLNVLDKYVSKFIICEATFNHKGEEKKLKFNPNNFAKFKSKIEYIILESKPENLRIINDNDTSEIKKSKILDNALIRENFQRNFVNSTIKKYNGEDLVLINDLDEIPNLEKFKYKKKISIFEQKMIYFKFNLMYPNMNWLGSKICKIKHLESPQWLRNIKPKIYPLWRLDILFSKKKYNDISFINEGGWHFTNIKKPEEIHYKMKNFLHHFEYEKSGLGVKEIEKLIKEKRALYNYSVDQRENKWNINTRLIEIDLNKLPDYILENKDRYREYL